MMKKSLLICFMIFSELACFSQEDKDIIHRQNSKIVSNIDSICASIDKLENLSLRFESGGRIDGETKKVIHYTNIYYLDTANNEMRKAYLFEVETKKKETYYFEKNKLIKVIASDYSNFKDARIYFDKIQVIAINEFVSEIKIPMDTFYNPYSIKARIFLRKFFPIVIPEPY
jgi:hypothetical protein